ncbi:hypothetical protein E1294_17440 [Nonomuraea diastatica]|uniref:Uncharacterized protein n=1 Tax=Nonomuraea diastatica TaxID=1848329 RepID=A0A4R4WSK3_9ACTN|nr:hypothetical protein E1294_17440 [Nonomuraea diastatica]
MAARIVRRRAEPRLPRNHRRAAGADRSDGGRTGADGGGRTRLRTPGPAPRHLTLGLRGAPAARRRLLVCPASLNTINKWAAGVGDTLALGLITEDIGVGLPIIAAPAVNGAQAAHPCLRARCRHTTSRRGRHAVRTRCLGARAGPERRRAVRRGTPFTSPGRPRSGLRPTAP